MGKFRNKGDSTRNNLLGLIRLYEEYRRMQYDIFKQYNLLLEDPKLDEIYLNLEPLVKYCKYLENDLNGTPDHSSSTEIIKELKKLDGIYMSSVESFSKEKRKDIFPRDALNS